MYDCHARIDVMGKLEDVFGWRGGGVCDCEGGASGCDVSIREYGMGRRVGAVSYSRVESSLGEDSSCLVEAAAVFVPARRPAIVDRTLKM